MNNKDITTDNKNNKQFNQLLKDKKEAIKESLISNNIDTNVSSDNNDINLSDSKNNDIKNGLSDAINPNNSLPPKKTVKPLTDLEIEVINNYYNNGYNKAQAYKDAVKKQDMYTSSATNLCKAILKKPQAQAYISELQNEVSYKANLGKQQLANEINNWVYADATQLIGLTTEQIKELPSEIRRSIQGYKEVTKTVKGRDGNETTIKTIDCKMVDKNAAIDKAIKLQGYYEIHNNQQKTISIVDMLNTMDIEAKKVMLNWVQSIKQ